MKAFYAKTVQASDKGFENLLNYICRDPENMFRGGLDDTRYLVEPPTGASIIHHACMVYSCADSEYYKSPVCLETIENTCDFIERVMHPDGTCDFLATNYYTPATFEIQAFARGYQIFSKYMEGTPDEKRVLARMKHVLERLGDGCINGGFHTPNHRWVESSALMMLSNIVDRPDFMAKAKRYLTEGIDCDEYGEFTERSMGCYNPINCNSLMIMAEEGNMPELYEYVKRNMELTFNYFDGDGTIFTKNSRRQDQDNSRTYPAHIWYYLYLWYGFLFGEKKYLAFARDMAEKSMEVGNGIPAVLWLFLKHPELKEFEPDLSGVSYPDSYTAFYPASGILRMRKGDFTATLIANKADFLYIKFGKSEMTARMCSSFFAVAQFEPKSIEKTETGYRMCFTGHGEYKGQFDVPPETSDWFKMDHSKRPVLHSCDLDYTVDVTLLDDGIRLHIVVDNTPRVPFKLELSIPVGTRLETDQIIMDTTANGSLAVKSGDMRLEDISTCSEVTVRGLFAKHMYHRNMRGSVAPKPDMFAVYATDFSPVDRVVEFRFSKRRTMRSINDKV